MNGNAQEPGKKAPGAPDPKCAPLGRGLRLCADLHTHSLVSAHAYSTIEECVRSAAEIGLELIANTDHGPSLADGAHPWHFNNLRVLPRIWHGVALLRGIEANVLPGGRLDPEIEMRTLKRLDVVIASFHNCYPPASKAEHTRDLLRIIAEGQVDILGHLGNPDYPIDEEEVLGRAAEAGMALELNATSDVNTRPGSTPGCVRLAKIAAALKMPVSVGTDAHVASFVGHFEKALEIIELSGVSEEQLICTSGLKVLDFLERRGHAPLTELREHFLSQGAAQCGESG